MQSTGIAALILTYKYPLLFPLAVVEGPVLTLLCGFLVHLGLMAAVPAYVVLYVADMVGDIAWYWIGRRWGASFILRFGRYVSITQERVAAVTGIFQRNTAVVILFSKMTMGLGFPGATLFTAGLARIPLPRFLALDGLGQIVWTGFLMTIGYSLGQLAATISGVLGLASSFAIMAILAALLFGFARFMYQALLHHTL